MFGLPEMAAMALLCAQAQAMKLNFSLFTERAGHDYAPVARDNSIEHELYKRAPTYITNYTLPDTNYT